MLEKIFAIALLLGGTRLQAEDWSCRVVSDPPECSGLKLDDVFSSQQHSCLSRLYTCGRYQNIAEMLGARSLGLSVEQKYFLGIANFGLSNRTNAQSLKCFYVRQAKGFLEEFLYDMENSPAEKINLASQQRMDALYQGSRIFATLKAESGCVESSFSEGSIDRMARTMTHDSMRTLLHNSGGSESIPTGAQKAAQAGFDSMRSTLNSFVTDSSLLESRFALYQTQLKSAQLKIVDIAKILQEGLGDKAVKLVKNDLGFEVIVINPDELGNIPAVWWDTYNKNGKYPFEKLDDEFKDFFAKSQKYPEAYDEMNQQKIRVIKDLMQKFGLYIDTIQVKSPEALLIHATLSEEQPGYETPKLIRGPIQDFVKKGKSKYCKTSGAEDYWYCNP